MYLFRNEGEFNEYRTGRWTRAFYQSGPDLDAVAGYLHPAMARSIRHEMMHRRLQRTEGPLPQWMEEGLAEYFSNVERTREGARVGGEIGAHARLLSNERWLTAAEWLGGLEPEEPSSERTAMFYAQSWAVVHRLMQSPTARLDMKQFAERLRKGMAQEEAFRIAFGRTVEKATEETKEAVASGNFPTKVVAGPLAADALKSVSKVDEKRAALALCELYLMTGRAEQAGALLAQVAKPDETDSEFAVAAALVRLRQGDTAGAKAGLEQAMRMGTAQGPAYFEYAMLLRDTGGKDSEVEGLLKRTVELAPSHAEAWFLLGRSSEKKGNVAEAVNRYARATEALPRQFAFWDALANARRLSGDEPGAREAAMRAKELAKTPQEMEMAKGTLRELDAPKPAPEKMAAETAVAKGWEPPKGDSVAEGRLAFVDCAGNVLKFHVAQGKRRVVLGAKDPSRIFLKGKSGEKREFVCGPQRGQPAVAVEYLAKADAKEKTTGEVVSIEFK
jgi:tetratricopeptide (TPR) repeat protein